MQFANYELSRNIKRCGSFFCWYINFDYIRFMKQQHKEWITLAAPATALLSIGMFIGYLTSIIANA